MIIEIYSNYASMGLIDVSHVDGNTTAKRFENEWNGCMDAVKELFPEEWGVHDIKKAMLISGWQIKDMKIETTVAY